MLIDIYETIELDLNLFQYIIKVERHDALWVFDLHKHVLWLKRYVQIGNKVDMLLIS